MISRTLQGPFSKLVLKINQNQRNNWNSLSFTSRLVFIHNFGKSFRTIGYSFPVIS